jgi:hypothetical protein
MYGVGSGRGLFSEIHLRRKNPCAQSMGFLSGLRKRFESEAKRNVLPGTEPTSSTIGSVYIDKPSLRRLWVQQCSLESAVTEWSSRAVRA